MPAISLRHRGGMPEIPHDVLDEIDRLALAPRWSVHDLRPTTRALLAAMPTEAVQCVLEVTSSLSGETACRLTRRATVVLACHDQGGEPSRAPRVLVAAGR